MVHGWRALVSALAALAVLTGAASAAAYEPAPELTSGPALIQDADCTGAEEPSAGAPPATAAPAAGQTVVSFTVPSTTRLRVEQGAVVAAATNSGCVPRTGDRFLVGDRPATAAEEGDALDAFTSGDWRVEGAWHPAP